MLYVESGVEACYPDTIGIFYVSHAGASVCPALFEARLYDSCEERPVAHIDDARECDLLPVARNILRPDGLLMVKYHSVAADVPKFERGAVVAQRTVWTLHMG